MKIATSINAIAETREAVSAAYQELCQKLGDAPTWIAVHATEQHNGFTLMSTLRPLAPRAQIQGGTSCQGVMTEAGFKATEKGSLALFGLLDPLGAYGVGITPRIHDPRANGAAAIRQALAAAGKGSEKPALVWLTCAPGYEEDILLGIEDVLGPDVPVAGGSSADNNIAGGWSVFGNGNTFTNGLVVTAMYPSTPVHVAFSSGYFATPNIGKVTQAKGRVIETINNRPAAEVYNEWTHGAIKDMLGGGKVLSATSLAPLGRVVKQVGAIKYYQLSHPESVTRTGGLELFSKIEIGEEVTQMMGTKAGLVNRVGMMTNPALSRVRPGHIAGGLVIYCAGCMLTVQNDMETAVNGFRSAFQQQPFLGTFTFGEQGFFAGGSNRHGNLMVSAVVFEKE